MPNPFLSLRVLIVEDSLVNQRLLTGLVERWNCTVTLATDGQQALDTLAAEEFDVVLMDVQMPVMDGLSATHLIRQQEACTAKHTPIVAVTAGMDRQSCLEAGMDEHLGKPVRAELLYQTLAQLPGRLAKSTDRP